MSSDNADDFSTIYGYNKHKMGGLTRIGQIVSANKWLYALGVLAAGIGLFATTPSYALTIPATSKGTYWGNPTALNMLIPYTPAELASWDNTTDSELAKLRAANKETPRNMINHSVPYHDKIWLSLKGRPNVVGTDTSPARIPFRSRSVDLQINAMTFLPFSLVQPDENTNNPSSDKKVTTTNYPHDLKPVVTDKSTNYPAQSRMTDFGDSVSVTSDNPALNGKLSAKFSGGKNLDTQKDNNSRYWFSAGSIPVAVTSSVDITVRTKITVTLTYRKVKAYWGQGYNQCMGGFNMEYASKYPVAAKQSGMNTKPFADQRDVPAVCLPQSTTFNIVVEPPPVASCGAGDSTMPPTGVPGADISFTVSTHLSPGWVADTMSQNEADPSAANPKFHVTLKDPDGAIVIDKDVAYSLSGTGKSILTSGLQTYTPTKRGKYTLTWGLSGSSLQDSVVCPGVDANNVVLIGDQPYFSVYGGDIMVGLQLAGSTSPSAADIFSWNRDNAASAGYAGASTELAAIASGNIKSFVTAGATAPSANPATLAFANTTKSGTTYGGGYNAFGSSPDYIQTAQAKGWTNGPSNTIDLSTMNSGIFHYTGDVTLSGNVTAGKNITIVVEGGSVFIGGNITYTYSSLNEIPRLNVYAKGNIIVGTTVSEIHGVFVVQGTGNKFYTCGTSATAAIDYSSLTTNYNTCNKQLTIYGSVVTPELILSRTYGSWNQPNSSAETFKHGPVKCL